MRLKIQLPDSWADCSKDNPDGPATFCRHLSEESGALQVSWAEYSAGPVPNPSADDLKQMAAGFGRHHNMGELIESHCGPCLFGHMGTAIFRSKEYAHFQVWFLSNGRDFINVTYICVQDPGAVEVCEAQEIVRTLILTGGK